MRQFTLFFFISNFLFTNGICGQEEALPINNYPEGIYLSFEDFLTKKPANTQTVEMRDVMRPKQKVLDPTIDNCYFYYRRKNKRVKDAFAISYKGSLFIRIKEMRKYMVKKDRRQKIEFHDSFIRVVDQGQFLYMEGYFRKGGGLGLSIGAGPVAVGSGGPREEMKGIVFNFEKQEFDIFRDCKDFNNFLLESTNRRPFKCDQKSVPLPVVRRIIFELNSPEIEQE